MVRKLTKSIVISGTSYTYHSTTSRCKIRMASLGREEGRENESWGGVDEYLPHKTGTEYIISLQVHNGDGRC